MSYTYIPTKLRKLIAKRANYCCEYCLQPENLSFVSHQADHIDGLFSSTTAIGRGTIRLLKLNQIERIEERKLMISQGLLSVSTLLAP